MRHAQIKRRCIDQKNTVGQWLVRVAVALGAVVLFVNPAAASHDNLGCDPPEEFTPLLDFLHSVEELGVIFAVTILTLSVIAAGVFYMLPGEDNTRRAKLILKNGVLGMLIVFMAPMLSAFLISSFEGVFC